MSAARTCIEIPEKMNAGLWVDSQNKTDEESQRWLLRGFSAKTALSESPTVEPIIAKEHGILFCPKDSSSLPGPYTNLVSGFPLPGLRGQDISSALLALSGSSQTGSVFGYRQLRIREGYRALGTLSATSLLMDRITEERFEAVFQRGARELFEDGIESEFIRELEQLVRAYGTQSQDILTRLFEDDNLSAEVRAEAMRWVGIAEMALPRESRLWLLEKGLTSTSAPVRDGAALGLASMNDANAIPYLERAASTETIDELRASMEQVLTQLKSQNYSANVRHKG